MKTLEDIKKRLELQFKNMEHYRKDAIFSDHQRALAKVVLAFIADDKIINELQQFLTNAQQFEHLTGHIYNHTQLNEKNSQLLVAKTNAALN